MMKKNTLIAFVILSMFFVGRVGAQEDVASLPPLDSDAAISKTVQPKIMVIPFTKEGEDIRTVLEADVARRIAITKVKEGFDQRNFTTVDFVGKLKAAKDNQVFASDNQTDIKTQIIEMSGADIYVVVEVAAQSSPEGNSASLILTAYEVSTGNSLANKIGHSGMFYVNDFGKLSQRAVEDCIDSFLDVMNSKFSEIVENGKSVIVEISFAPGSTYTMASEVGASKLPFSDTLEEWFEKNSYKSSYHVQGVTSIKMVLDDVKIPLKDPETKQNFNANKFALKLFKYLRSLDMSVEKDIKGNTIYITIK